MYIELIDLLRCPVEHEETWLVASFNRIEARFVIEGKLGCPTCSATYDIADGVVYFTSGVVPVKTAQISDDDILRTSALLNLTRPDSLAVLCGAEARVANRVSEMTQARIIAINPDTNVDETERVAVVICADRIPLASQSVDAVAIGSEDSLKRDSARILKPGSRISAAASVELGPGFLTLARDDRHVVGEVVGPMIQIGRR